MNESLKLLAKISAKASARWIIAFIIGAVIFIIGFSISIFLIGNNSGSGFAGARAGGIGAILGILVLFGQEFFTALLLFGSFGMLVLYGMAANKIALQTVLFETWKNKGTGFIVPKIAMLINKIQNIKGVNAVTNAVLLQSQLLKQNAADQTTPKIQRKIIGYGLRKIRLDTVDIENADDVPAIVAAKIENKIADAAQPTFKPLGYLVLLHIVLIVLALVFDHK